MTYSVIVIVGVYQFRGLEKDCEFRKIGGSDSNIWIKENWRLSEEIDVSFFFQKRRHGGCEWRVSTLPARMDRPLLAFSTWCGTASASVPAAVGFQRSTQRWHCGTERAGYAILSPVWTQETATVSTPELNTHCHTQITEGKKNPQHLVLFQELQLDGDVVSHLLVLLSVDLEQLLGLLNLGQGVGIAWPKIQLLQISAVSVVLNPGKEWSSNRKARMLQIRSFHFKVCRFQLQPVTVKRWMFSSGNKKETLCARLSQL